MSDATLVDSFSLSFTRALHSASLFASAVLSCILVTAMVLTVLSPLSMERALERFRRRLCLRVFRAEYALLLKKNASTMNIAHVSMAQIAAPITVRADKVCYPTR